MKIHDVSVTISEDMPIWPGDPKVTITKKRAINRGDSCNVSHLAIGSHTGTHIDAPYHFEESGLTIDQLSLETLIGEVRVFDLSAESSITLEKVRTLDLDNVTRVLFKTKNSDRWKSGIKSFSKEFIPVPADVAGYLVETGIKLVGVDYLSVEGYGSKDHPTHHTLLKNGIIVVEGLNLSSVDRGDYELIALPIKVLNCDGSPARVILMEKE